MAFIGNRPADTFHTTVKQSFTPDSSTTAFTLNQSVAGENEIELFINNVRQEPGSGKLSTAQVQRPCQKHQQLEMICIVYFR